MGRDSVLRFGKQSALVIGEGACGRWELVSIKDSCSLQLYTVIAKKGLEDATLHFQPTLHPCRVI